MRKAVIYARVSSKEQEQGFSLEAQIKVTRRYADERQFTIVHEFAKSESAQKEGRKHFNEMLQFLRSNLDIRVIIVEKTDRLYRNLHDVVAVEDLVEELDAEVHLVKEGQVVKKETKSQDKLVQGIHALLARNYILNMKEEIGKGQAIKAEKGQYPGRAPFGYMHDLASRTIVPHPKRGLVVTLIFDLYESGMHSIVSLRRKIIEASGERISKSHLQRMLKNRSYIGYFVWRGIEYKGTHAPLVDHSKFQRVQEVLSGRNVNKCKPHKLLFPFAGLMICAHCGCGLTAERHKGKYDYYRCSFGRGRHRFAYMPGKYVSDSLAEVLRKIQIPKEVVERITESLRNDFDQTEMQRKETVSRLHQRLSALRTRMKKAYQDKLEGNIDEEFWAQNHNEWSEEQRHIEAQLQKMSQLSPEKPALSIQRIIELAESAHSIYLTGNDAERAELLRTVLSNCQTDGVSFSPAYRKPFDIIFQRGQNEEWRRERDSNGASFRNSR